jgi:hypothetical protein
MGRYEGFRGTRSSIISAEVTLKSEEHIASIIRVTATLIVEAEFNFWTMVATCTTARCSNLDAHGLNLQNL